MKTNCGLPHKISSNNVCCLTYIIEATDISQNHLNFDKFSQNAIKALKTLKEDENFVYEKLSLPFIIKFLQSLSKLANHFFFSVKENETIEYTTLLIKLSMRCIKNIPKDKEQQVKGIKYNLFNNLSCILAK